MELRRSRRLLTGVAILFGAVCAYLLVRGAEADSVGNTITFYFGVAAVVPVLIAITLIIRNPPIGKLDDAGVWLKSWGIGPIAWKDVESYGVDDPGEGGPIVSLYLRNEDDYIDAANGYKRQMARIRRSHGLSSFVIYAANTDQSLATLVAEISKRVPVRAVPPNNRMQRTGSP